MKELGLPGPGGAVEIAEAYLAEFSNPQKRSRISVNILNRYGEILDSAGLTMDGSLEFVNFIERFQADIAGEEYGVEIDIARSLTLLEFTEAARCELAVWQAGSGKHQELYPYANEWALRVVMLESATRIKTQRDVQLRKLV